MVNRIFTNEEVEWIKKHYPSLILNADGRELSGRLNFLATFNKESGKFLILKNGGKNMIGGETLDCNYEITIKIRNDPHTVSNLPAVYTSEQEIKPSPERHFSFDKSACLCNVLEEESFVTKGYSFLLFLEELVIPFFYEQKFYDRYKKWPWGEYGHGNLGLLEYYSESRAQFGKDKIVELVRRLRSDVKWKEYGKYLNKRKPRRICLCPSGIYFDKCHPEAWRGLQLLQDTVKNLKIDIYRC